MQEINAETNEYKKEIDRLWARDFSRLTKKETAKSRAKEIDAYTKKVITPLFPADQNARILELGSGVGNFLAACRQTGYNNIMGVELMAELAAQSEEREQENIEVGDLQTALKKEEKYDVVCAFDVLEHFSRPELLPILKSIYDALKPGGRFIFRAPNGASPKGAYILYSDLTHEIMFTDYLINEILGALGFTDIAVYPWKKPEGAVNNILQRLIARAFGLDKRLLFSGNLLAAARKNNKN